MPFSEIMGGRSLILIEDALNVARRSPGQRWVSIQEFRYGLAQPKGPLLTVAMAGQLRVLRGGTSYRGTRKQGNLIPLDIRCISPGEPMHFDRQLEGLFYLCNSTTDFVADPRQRLRVAYHADVESLSNSGGRCIDPRHSYLDETLQDIAQAGK